MLLQHRTEGLCRSQGIAAGLAETATSAAGRAVVATGYVAHHFCRPQFSYGIEEFPAESIIENDLQGTVLVQQLAKPLRLSESLLHQKAIGRELPNLAFVGAGCRYEARFLLYLDAESRSQRKTATRLPDRKSTRLN